MHVLVLMNNDFSRARIHMHLRQPNPVCKFMPLITSANMLEVLSCSCSRLIKGDNI